MRAVGATDRRGAGILTNKWEVDRQELEDPQLGMFYKNFSVIPRFHIKVTETFPLDSSFYECDPPLHVLP